MTLRNRESGAIILQQEAAAPILHAGLCDVPLSCLVELGESEYCLEIEVSDAAAFEGARVELFTLRSVERLKTHIPPTHMETRACLLVLQLALELSDETPFAADDCAERLTAFPSAAADPEVLATAIRRLEGWRADGLCVIGIGMGCSSAIRKWPTHYFTELAKELLQIGQVTLVFVGSDADRDEALQACRELGLDPAPHMLCGVAALADLGQVLRLCDLFVSNNTGTLHFAGRAGVRTIGIYAGTNHPREFGPVGPNTSWLFRDEACAPCFLSELKNCHYGHRCLRDLLPSDVLAFLMPEIASVLSRRSAAKSDLNDGNAWLPFLDAYRTMCLSPAPDFRRILEGVCDLWAPERRQLASATSGSV